MPKGRDGKVKVGLLASETPPPAGGRPSRTLEQMKAVVPLLREQKGTWFKVAEFEAPNGANGACGKMKKAFPKVEWTSRRNADGSGSVLYGRWVG